jgi:hypothetical protein
MSNSPVDAWFGAFRERDISELERNLAEDFMHSSPYGEVVGRKTYIDLVRSNEEAFFSPVIEIVDVLECGEKFAARYLVNGNPACDCIYVHHGQITKIYSYYHLGEKPEF